MADIPKAKAIEILTRLRGRLGQLPSYSRKGPEFEGWSRRVETALEQIFGSDSKQLRQYRALLASYPVILGGVLDDNETVGWTTKGVSAVEDYLAALVEEIQDFWPDDDASEVETRTVEKTQLDEKAHERGDPRVVLVVYGRDARLRSSLFHFLRALHLDPLEWSEWVKRTGKGSPYVGEIVATAFKQAQAVLVFVTPDDEVRLREDLQTSEDPQHETEFAFQARPNVFFEAGMSMARCEERTIIVEIGSPKPASDLMGRHVIRLDNSAGKRKELAQRLQTAGCSVNMDGDDWLKTGDFSAPSMPQSQVNDESSVTPVQAPLSLGQLATDLLMQACGSSDASILVVRADGGSQVIIGSRELIPDQDRRTIARYEHAIDELHNAGSVVCRHRDMGSEMYEVSHPGFEVADKLRGKPDTPDRPGH